ncbi:DUF4345 family protein [Kribbella solani]|uniref:Na+/glutamate symporter n=1 Tax=Kribbella solani TaxID=236067 RepID=A0A841DNF2_9ACTN|nr:DUF4345 family protein [Kribbella solani]MBB5980082.1 Na+/glutamate symporter [Kribbella solani]MDX2971284.1 DUF4345 family protein [Kribbella solani]MDX3005547.1 DUF4345 family protein [Kribbella solani]
MVVIVVVAVFFAGMGIYGLAAPAALVRPFALQADTGHARTEVRAVYGGFGLAIAAVLLVAATTPDLRRGVVLAVAIALLGMAAGRLIGRIADRPTAFYPIWFYFWVEVALAAALLLTIR